MKSTVGRVPRGGRVAIVLVSLLWIILGSCSPTFLSGGSVYHGRVIDAETNEPIEGAVVVVVWNKKPAITMDGPQYFHKAVEVLTDAQGRFSVDASPGVDLNPFSYVLKEPDIVIFKPGYGAFPIGYGSTKSIKELNEALLARRWVVVKLPRLESDKELRKFRSPARVGILSVVPFEQIPNLIRALNVQRKHLGLPPFRVN